MVTSENIQSVLKEKMPQYKQISFLEDLPLVAQGLSSLHLIVLLMDIETRFGIAIPATHLESLRSLSDIAGFVKQAQNKDAVAASIT